MTTSDAPRPVTSVYSLEIGAARDLSTYLSPLWYTGPDVALTGSWSKAFQHWPGRCTMQFAAAVDFQWMLNPARTARMAGLTAQFGWGLSWRHPLGRGWEVEAGGMIDLWGGVLYQMRNGNNPATALAYGGIDARGALTWHTRWGRLPVTLLDEVRIPTAGAFFTPGYGESYYEIYLGNHRGLLHFGWWGNAPGVDNLLALRLHLGRTGLQVGYRLDLRTLRANHLLTQVMRNALVIGVIP